MFEIFIAVIVLIFYFVLLSLHLRTRLLLVLACSIPQLYLVQIGGADVPLAFLIPALLLPEFLINLSRFLAKPTILILVGLIVISSFSLTWSVEK